MEFSTLQKWVAAKVIQEISQFATPISMVTDVCVWSPTSKGNFSVALAF